MYSDIEYLKKNNFRDIPTFRKLLFSFTLNFKEYIQS